jgi:PKHD-type hydroxylase
MLITIPNVLTAEQIANARQLLNTADWVDGKVTAGHQSALAKENSQVPEDHPVARHLGDLISSTLSHNPLFVSAALPLRIFPPLFNRYTGGQNFGTHVDNSIRQVSGTPHRIRTDISATLFFANPDEYDGGELCIEDTYGMQSVKLPAGDMVLYPSTSLHHVTPVTRGARICSFFWIQSMVRQDSQRSLLFDLDLAIQGLASQSLAGDNAENPEPRSAIERSAVQLIGVYHNLLRQWAEM